MQQAIDPRSLTRTIDDLADAGWSRRTDLVERELVEALAAEARDAFDAGQFRRGRVGRGEAAELRPEIRTDRVLWIDPLECSEAVRRYLTLMEQLRSAINRELQLGLFEFEGHLAVYPPGSFYKRHLDQTRGTPLRTVTCITYLNARWAESDGGQLRLYLPETPDGHVDLLPRAGDTLLFLSDLFEHEVLPASRDRASLTGWFRRRKS